MCASDNSELANYTGDSFRDLTRIAHINDKMWAELFLWNKDNLISEIDMFESALQDMREKLVRDDREGLEEMFRLSTKRREAFDRNKKCCCLKRTAAFLFGSCRGRRLASACVSRCELCRRGSMVTCADALRFRFSGLCRGR